MKHVFSYINNIERKYLDTKHRKSMWYFCIKVTVLFPLIALGFCEIAILYLYNLIVRGRIQREDKPDIVFKNIVAGFAGLAFPDEKTETLAKRRAEICATCPFAVSAGVRNIIVDNRTKQIEGMKCSACGCFLSAKVRSVNDYCPKGKW